MEEEKKMERKKDRKKSRAKKGALSEGAEQATKRPAGGTVFMAGQLNPLKWTED